MRVKVPLRRFKLGLMLPVCVALFMITLSVGADGTPIPPTNTPSSGYTTSETLQEASTPVSTNTPSFSGTTAEPSPATETPIPTNTPSFGGTTAEPLPETSTPIPTNTPSFGGTTAEPSPETSTPIPTNTPSFGGTTAEPSPETSTPQWPTSTLIVPYAFYTNFQDQAWPNLVFDSFWTPIDVDTQGNRALQSSAASDAFGGYYQAQFREGRVEALFNVNQGTGGLLWGGYAVILGADKMLQLTDGTTLGTASVSDITGSWIFLELEVIEGSVRVAAQGITRITAVPTAPLQDVNPGFWSAYGSMVRIDNFGISGTPVLQVPSATPSPISTATPVSATPSFTPTSTPTGTPFVPSQPAITSPVRPLAGVLRPTITWNPVPGATEYQVAVVDLETGIDYAPHATVTTTSFQVPYDLPQRVTTFYVRAGNNGLWSGWTFYNISVMLGDTPEYDSSVTTNRPTFTWTGIAGISSYTLQIDNNEDFSSPFVTRTVNGTSYTLSSGEALPAMGVYYYWRLKTATLAYPPAGHIFMYGTPLTSPEITSPTMYSTVGNVRPTITWNSVPNATRYEIAVIDGDTGEDVGPRAIVTTSQYKPGFNLPHKTNYVYVRAGNAQYWTQWSLVIFNVLLGSSPGDGAILSTSRPTFTWTAVPGASNYTLQIDDNADFTSPLLNRTQNGTTYTLASSEALPNPSGPYYWRVRASNLDYSNGYSYSFSIATPVPAMPTITGPAYDSVIGNLRPTAVWTSVAGATQYEVAFIDPWAGTDLVPRQIVTGTQYRPALNLPQQLIHLYVRAGSAGGWSDWTFSQFTAVLGNTPANGATVTTTRPTFTWTAVTGAMSYTLQVDDDADFSSPLFTRTTSSTSYTPTSAEALSSPGAVYYWHVSASNVAYPSFDYSRSILNGVIPTPTGLYTSYGDSTTPVTLFGQYDGIMLRWQAITPAPYSYDVQFSYTSDFAEPFMSGTTVDPYLFYWADSFTIEGKIYWRVRSVYNSASTWSSPKSFTLDFTPPPTPLAKTPAGGVISSTRPTFSWTSVTGATAYILYINDVWTGEPGPGFGTRVTSTSYTIPSTVVPLHQTRPEGYVWRVVAVDAAGNTSAPSPDIVFTVFSGLTPTAGQIVADTTPRFTWQAVSGTGADLWRLEIAASPDMSDLVYVSSNLPATSTSFTLPDANALPAGVYYWRVLRISENSEGVLGREVSIVTP